MQKYLISCCIILTSMFALGQDSSASEAGGRGFFQNKTIKASYHLGFMLAHRAKMQHIPKELVQGFEIGIERQGQNEKDWEKLYNNPTVGVSFIASGTGNSDILGQAYGLYGYVMLPLINSKRFKLLTAWGWGLGLLSKKFDAIDNHRNNTIGSNFNLFANVKLNAEIYATSRLAFVLGASFNHWSNASFKQPNLGLNVPAINLGMIYKFHETNTFDKLSKADKKALLGDEKNEYSAIASFGVKSRDSHDPKLYPCYSLSLNYARLWNPKYQFSAGLDFFYNTANKKQMEVSEEVKYHDNSALQMGFNIMYHQVMGKFSILAGPGIYLLDETNLHEFSYFRLGTRFFIKENFILSTILHTHGARADHFKIGLGYRLKR